MHTDRNDVQDYQENEKNKNKTARILEKNLQIPMRVYILDCSLAYLILESSAFVKLEYTV